MLLVQDARLLLLDEPVAGMSHDERDATGELLETVSRDRTVVVIEHDMDFLRRFARSVTVLHAGRVLSEGTVAAGPGGPAGAGGLPRPPGRRRVGPHRLEA